MKKPTRIEVTGPLLVFGGPYSNLQATMALRQVADDLGFAPHQVICTGDTVAYGAAPDETTALMRDWGCHVIAGNCEEQIAAGAPDCGCGFDEGSACDQLSKGWYPFALGRMSQEQRLWMAGLPSALVFELDGLAFRVVHGGVTEISQFLFASEREALAGQLKGANADVIIAGHAGLPFLERTGKGRRGLWFNAGVIGMPANDGTADGWYGLIRPSADGLVFETRRLAYDHGAAAAAMRRSGHANPYARALVTGLWPSLDVLPETERAATGRRLRERRLVLPRREHGDGVCGGAVAVLGNGS